MREFSPLFPGRIKRDTSTPPAEQSAPVQTTAPQRPERPEKSPESAQKEVDKEKSGAYIDLREQLASLSETQLKIISAIDKEGTHIDDIVERTGLGAAAVLTQLTVMTVKGIVRRMPGNRVALNVQRR